MIGGQEGYGKHMGFVVGIGFGFVLVHGVLPQNPRSGLLSASFSSHHSSCSENVRKCCTAHRGSCLKIVTDRE